MQSSLGSSKWKMVIARWPPTHRPNCRLDVWGYESISRLNIHPLQIVEYNSVNFLFEQFVCTCETCAYRCVGFASGRRWIVYYAFVRHHNLNDSSELLSECAVRGDWLTMLVCAQLFHCSPSKVRTTTVDCVFVIDQVVVRIQLKWSFVDSFAQWLLRLDIDRGFNHCRRRPWASRWHTFASVHQAASFGASVYSGRLTDTLCDVLVPWVSGLAASAGVWLNTKESEISVI